MTMAALALVAGCSASAEPVSEEALVDALKGTDVDINEFVTEDASDSGMVPGGYQHHISIVLDEVAPSGGQFFICDERQVCDDVKGYFDALESLVGPHRYQSESGRVVAQLNSEVSQDTADKIVSAIEEL